MNDISFSDIAVVSCGTLTLALNHLKKETFHNARLLLFTTPGFHEDLRELEMQLSERIDQAKQKGDKVLVVYGGNFVI